jgi:hypothetical protein
MMAWLITVPAILVAAYAVLCLLIGRDLGEGGNLPYWLLLAGCVVIVYVAWFHPVRIVLA